MFVWVDKIMTVASHPGNCSAGMTRYIQASCALSLLGKVAYASFNYVDFLLLLFSWLLATKTTMLFLFPLSRYLGMSGVGG